MWKYKIGFTFGKKLELDLEKLPSNHELRPIISNYHPSDREEIRRMLFSKRPLSAKRD